MNKTILELDMEMRKVQLNRHNMKGNICKKCGSHIVPVGRFNYTEYCRTCGNWQTSF